MKTCYYGEDSDKNNIADKLPALWDAFLAKFESIPNTVEGLCYGVITQENSTSEKLEYMAAIEVTSVENLPEGMEVMQFTGQQYAKFTHRGQVNNLNNTVNYIYASWLMASDKKHSYQADLEIYDHQYHPTSEDSVVYYAIPVV